MVRNMDTSKYLQESVVSIRNGRYVVPVKSEYRGEVSGVIHDVSSTGATVFVAVSYTHLDVYKRQV